MRFDPAPTVVSFDCYGTLVQWHAAVRAACRTVLAAHLPAETAAREAPARADRLRAAAVSRQDRPPFCDYKSVLRAALDETLAELGLSATPEDHAAVRATLGQIAPHPEVPAALARLRTRYRVAIISNTDDDLIAGTVAAIGTPIDVVVTAEQARAYKPDHRLFRYAHAALGVPKEDIVHVGMGLVTDMKVCTEMGIRSVWIDRLGEPANPAWPPDAVLPDLAGLPALLGV